MQNLKKDLKSGEYKNVYLLYGTESYLKRFYKNQLKSKIINDDDTMNYAHFDARSYDVKEVMGFCDTMPFFSDYRLVIVENSGVCKGSNDELAEYIPNIPDTAILVFVEEAVDKRNKVFKAIQAKGLAVEFTALKSEELNAWVGGFLRKNNTNMTNNAYNLFLSKVGTDLENIEKELKKLVDYTYGRDSISVEDVEAICTVQVENKIFDMIDAIIAKDMKKAMDKYYDLLTLKEPPMRILFLISKQYNQLLKLKSLREAGFPVDDIAKKAGMSEWLAKKNLNMAGKFSVAQLEKCVSECVIYEEAVKTGKINDRLSVEIIISKFVSM